MTSPRTRSLVTGSSRGIGAAVAQALAARGDRVAVHYGSNADAAREVLAGLPGDGHVLVSGDLADPAAVADLVAAAVEGLGGVDVLVNNAAAHDHLVVEDSDYDQWQASWQRVLSVNVLGTANVSWQVVRYLLDRPEGPEGGRLVTVGSRGAFRGEPQAMAYGASKAAVHSLTQSLALALGGHGIGVSAVAPGFVATDMATTLLAGPVGEGIRAQSPFGRVGEPPEIAAAIAFLTGPDALWCSGAVLDVNGASYLR
ncbi:SDR family NAD(P)-dependent oxidoreductase [Modestobacter sp. Leaf380]|uniref:SDR family NAD(P)-dependent oxidoreductase n=1 Tax=Modestobacter sp. Leaf380 TaxID=1736356 RepID=UPI0006FFA011|nr:SDR family oxidoreductase [Modestobacter sp. Leaf380]KQS69194.1 3-oxoacyl-ACP reductase [Modestobacter sp. Leaf380]